MLGIVTNEISSFCIDNRLRQMAFSCSFKWVKVGFRVMLKCFELKQSFMCSSLFSYYKKTKQIDSMLPCACSVIDHRRRQNVVSTHSAIASCATFLFLPHFDVICNLFLNRRTATQTREVAKHEKSVRGARGDNQCDFSVLTA